MMDIIIINSCHKRFHQSDVLAKELLLEALDRREDMLLTLLAVTCVMMDNNNKPTM